MAMAAPWHPRSTTISRKPQEPMRQGQFPACDDQLGRGGQDGWAAGTFGISGFESRKAVQGEGGGHSQISP